MKISSFTIRKFKSIEDLSFPLEVYGKGKNKSSVAILVGLNESGKSSILEAIDLFQKGFDGREYEDYLHKNSEEDNPIEIEANIEILSEGFFQKKISEALNLPEEFTSKIKFLSFKRETWMQKEKFGSYNSISINSDLPFYNYIIIKVMDKEKIVEKVKNLKEYNKIDQEITSTNAKSFIKDGQELLTKSELEKLILSKLVSTFRVNIPKIQLWKPDPEFLINKVIDLESFKDDTSISAPLKNIFHINGINTDEKIQKAIEKALKRPESKAELQVNLSNSITIYINKIWKEHKINIKINIDGSSCSVHVEDKDKEHKYFNMKQRSDGFNQFISLILSLSTQNDSKELTDTIILLDEPEIHLHPSGVRYMRDEILKIGKTNTVIVSTHSHYMIDTVTPERHFIVSKKEMNSQLKQVDESTSMNDDQVLASAFGISLFKELLPQNIIVVEGGDDKVIFSHCLSIFHKDFFYSIKSAGGTSKVYGIASILADEKIPAFFVLDDDKDGNDEKRSILEKLKGSFDKNHVLTIRDISGEIPSKSTLEDLLPQQFVKDFFEKEM